MLHSTERSLYESISAARPTIPSVALSSIFRALYPGELKTPLAINKGHDYVWAYVVSKLVDGTKFCEVRFKTGGDHVFLQKDELFYDAEDLLGVADWRSLKLIKRNLRTSELVTQTVKHLTQASLIKTRMEKGEAVRLDKMVEHNQKQAKVSNFDAYSWYQYIPFDSKSLVLTDLKGNVFDLDPNTKYGVLPVKLGIRVIDSEDPTVFFVVTDQAFRKLLSKSTILRKCPLKSNPTTAPTQALRTADAITVVNGRVSNTKTHNRPVVVVEQTTQHQPTVIQPMGRLGVNQDEDNDTSIDVYADKIDRIIDVDGLQHYNEVDDLSVELFGHRLHEFEDRDYSDLDSFSATNVSTSSLDIKGIVAPGAVATLGKAYLQFFDSHPLADQARSDKSVAEASLIPIVKSLYTYLSDLGFEVSAVRGFDFTKRLEGCSSSIEKWQHLNKTTAISHLAVKVNNLILDPCFKRLGNSVRVDNYALSDFQRLWRTQDVIASQASLSHAQSCDLFSKTAKELQVPTPNYVEPTSILSSSTIRSKKVSNVTRIKLSGGCSDGSKTDIAC